jgi:hypothetical protein
VLERTTKMGIITNETLINHLHCQRKAFLKAVGTPGVLERTTKMGRLMGSDWERLLSGARSENYA